MFCTDACECFAVGGQEMEYIADGTACRVMTSEHKQAYLPYCKSPKLGVQIYRRCFCILGHIRLQDDVNHRFAPGVGCVGLVFVVAFIELFSNVVIHLTAVPPMHVPSSKIQVLEWIVFCVGLMPTNLAQHAVSQRVVALLSPEGSIPAFHSAKF